MRIKMTYDGEFVMRQTPAQSGIWGDHTFLEGPDVRECDAWVVYEQLQKPETVVCDPARTVFVTGEPPSVRSYDPKFLSQFGAVVTPHEDIMHPIVFRQQPAIPWWVGRVESENIQHVSRLDFDFFNGLETVPKSRLLSIVCSSKALTEGHRQRLQLVERLKKHFDDQVDVFGRGHKPFGDKWDVVQPYKYTVVLENCVYPDYWSEKVADAFLAQAYPLYSGCPNLSDYFPCESFERIDLERPQETIATITRVIESNTYEKALPYIRESRGLVLNRYNVFPMVAELLDKLPSSSHRGVSLKPEWYFTSTPIRRLRRSIKNSLSRILN